MRNALLRRPLDAPRVSRAIVVFLGERRQLLDRVEVLPLAEFLGELPG